MNTLVKNIRTLVGLVLIFGLFSFSAQALTPREVRDLLRATSQKCPKLNCTQARAYVRPLNSAESTLLRDSYAQKTTQASLDFARDIWPDTILEGFINVEFQVRIDNVEMLVIDGKVSAYRIAFSTPAWEDKSCNHVRCANGRVFERFYWLPDSNFGLDDESVDTRFVKDRP